MGEAADDAIEGLTCECCGEFLDGEAPGYPRKCNGCTPSKNPLKAKPAAVCVNCGSDAADHYYPTRQCKPYGDDVFAPKPSGKPK